jgi:hypothetical protein
VTRTITATVVGDLGYTTAVNAYRSTLEMHRPNARPFGLTEQAHYLYGGWYDSRGAMQVVERKFIGPLTGGCWWMAQDGKDGEFALSPHAVNTARGEIKRLFSDSEHHFHGPSLLGGAGGSGEHVLDYRLTEDTLTWHEGEAMQLTGTLVGPGVQIAVLDGHEPFVYLSQLYRARGRALDEDVEAFLWLDRAYWPHGTEWKEFAIYARKQISWTVFANEFTNGDIEWGQVAMGTDGFNFVAVVDADGPVAMESMTGAGVDSDPDDWAQRLGYRCSDGRTWIFELGVGGHLTPFAKARWSGYRPGAGLTTRHGETRELKFGFSWGEFFADRVRAAGIGSVDDLLK